MFVKSGKTEGGGFWRFPLAIGVSSSMSEERGRKHGEKRIMEG